MAATDMHATIEEMLEVVFSVQSVPRLDNEVQLPFDCLIWKYIRKESCDGSEKSRKLVWDGCQPGS
jgi:hypothetical protein